MRAPPALRAIAVVAILALVSAGCLNQRYHAPAALSVGGAALAVAGSVTLVAAPENPAGRASAASLLAVGVAALLGASLWLGLRVRCTNAVDCPEGETCQPVPTAGGQSYGVCVPSS